jgi:alanyl-tRNA synthetase
MGPRVASFVAGRSGGANHETTPSQERSEEPDGTMDSRYLRRAFTEFFTERGHSALAPASLVPNDPTVLFTIAGMVPFKPYFLGEAPPPAPRVTTVQPCLRTSDIEMVGRTARHCTFFEMLGNFSFGDYFKQEAIPWAFEFVTEVLGLELDRLWATVHLSDDEAAEIWPSSTSLPAERVQRLGEDNFWRMGETGPCGPSSEIFFDLGEELGPPGGPAAAGAEESGRYTEVWNLVFMQFNQLADGELEPLPKRNIDTGAGLDRLLVVIEGVDNVQEIDCVKPIVERAAELTGQRFGFGGPSDTGLRIIADHARAFTFAIADGVFPSNEGRGYVLRRIIRRAVMRAQQLGRRGLISDELVEAVISTMGTDYPVVARDADRIKKVALHEEETFLRTLRQGTALLESELEKGSTNLSGEVAFRLHDTFGLPFELTKELADERGVTIDEAGYAEHMEAQRRRGRQQARDMGRTPEELAARWRELRVAHGATEFLGYDTYEADATVLDVFPSAVDEAFLNVDGEGAPDGSQLVEVYLDRTPFYAEGGGQVGDTGEIATPTGRLRVIDTTAVVEGLTRHLGYVVAGTIEPGSEARAVIDAPRREAIRRNHTGTHLLHWALRQVLGDHVRQQGSLVAPDRLRFDFSHFGPLSEEERADIESLVNSHVIADEPVVTTLATREDAERSGAIAFFGEKYGEQVRVVQAGLGSVELCGGTHVAHLGMIGPLKIITEGSIGANTRRIEALTGEASLARIREEEQVLQASAELLRATPEELTEAVSRLVARERELEEELVRLRRSELNVLADSLAPGDGRGGRVVARQDGLDPNRLRELALLLRDRPGVEAVAVVGSPAEGRVALVVASRVEDVDARQVASAAAAEVGGGGGGTAQLATAGGRDVSAIGRALDVLQRLLEPAGE